MVLTSLFESFLSQGKEVNVVAPILQKESTEAPKGEHAGLGVAALGLNQGFSIFSASELPRGPQGLAP